MSEDGRGATFVVKLPMATAAGVLGRQDLVLAATRPAVIRSSLGCS